MRKFNKKFSNESGDMKYDLALRKVQRIKSFYNHLLAYVIFNTIIILTNHWDDTATEFWRFNTFSVAFFWGIGLVCHAVSVFGKNIFFSAEWDERKIRELMEKNKKQNWE